MVAAGVLRNTSAIYNVDDHILPGRTLGLGLWLWALAFTCSADGASGHISTIHHFLGSVSPDPQPYALNRKPNYITPI